MSKENVRLFYRRLADDTALQEKFNEINARLVEGFGGERPDDLTSGSVQPPTRYCRMKLSEERMDELFQRELLPVAKGAGLEFSLDELKAYASETKETGELSDSELATVAGGSAGRCCVCVLGGYGENDGKEMLCFIGGTTRFNENEFNETYCFCVIGGSGTHA